MAKNENLAATPAENTPSQTLFRFVSMRSPELIDDKHKDKKFVFMPNETKDECKFYDYVKNGSGSKKKLLLEKAQDYSETVEFIDKDRADNNLDTFKRSYKIICDFAVWLARNKSTCTHKEFMKKRNEVLSSNVVFPSDVLLWDNFIYQIATQKDFYIKEMIMQVILAIHALKNATNDEEILDAILNARIVLPKEIMMNEEGETSASTTSKMLSSQRKPEATQPTEEMRRQQEISNAKLKISKIEKLKSSFSLLEKGYRRDYQEEYEKQQSSYQKEIAPILEKYARDVEVATAEYLEKRPIEKAYDSKNPYDKPKEVPYPKIPDFNFSFRDEVSAEALVSSLKPDNLETLLDLFGYEFDSENQPDKKDFAVDLEELLEGRKTFSEITALINESIEKITSSIVANTDHDTEVYSSIGGIMMPVSKNIIMPFTYQVCTRWDKKYFLDLAVRIPDKSWDISSVFYSITSSLGVYYENTTFTKTRVGNEIYLKDLFQPGYTFDVIENSTFYIKILFSNGKIGIIEADGISTGFCSSGNFGFEVKEGEEDEKNFIPSGFGIRNLGVADYLKVEQSTHAYVEGEVAHIENIMAREYREKSTRKLRRSENTTTSSSDTEREQLSDTTTANRFEMQNEIAKMQQESKDSAVNAHFGASWGTGGSSFNTGVGANFASHKSKEESTRQATTQAQDITARAMDRIVTKVHEERIEKIIDEFEETNSHGFDNKKGDKHVVGVYRWVDKLMKNQIYNYGKRMMFEFMVPEPAKLHLLGMKDAKSADRKDFVKPVDPRAEGNMQVKNFNSLTDDAILKYWITKYNVKLHDKLQDEIFVGKSFEFFSQDHENGTSKSGEITIPESYETLSATVSFAGMDAIGRWARNILVTVGNNTAEAFPNRRHVISGITLNNFVGSIPVTFACTSFLTANVSISIKCKTTQTYKEEWNKEAFNTIISAYEDALVEYNNSLAEESNKAASIKDSNPNFYRQIENTILRKNCISYMADRAGSTHGYGWEGSTDGSTFENYETVLSSDLDQYTAFVKFMEQAFEWENISYFLYPYYWGKKSNWIDLYQSENTDPLFRNFLQSGMARVVATVRPGFEDAVQFYLATGKIWNGGEVPVIGDELYLSIVDEMKQPKGDKQGKAWLTRLPTTLNILQAESIGLKVAHALPFTKENPDDFEIPSEVITEDKFNFDKNENVLGKASDDGEKIISGDWI